MPTGNAGRLSWLRRLFGAKLEPTVIAPEAEAPDAYTRPATWRDVLTTVRLLNHAGVRYVLPRRGRCLSG